MGDAVLSTLLKWSIENSDKPGADGTNEETVNGSTSNRGVLDKELMAHIMGGPSEADLMKQAMSVIHHPEATYENKMIAWDNFEQLVESLDNANNMSNLNLWTPMLEKLDDPSAEVRSMVCWCTSTAVQNNIKTQEAFFGTGALPKIVSLSHSDPDATVRRKAVNAMSSTVRNYQKAMDEVLQILPAHLRTAQTIDANDMEAVDELVHKLRENAAAPVAA